MTTQWSDVGSVSFVNDLETIKAISGRRNKEVAMNLTKIYFGLLNKASSQYSEPMGL